MNRRGFFRRTIGAIAAAALAPLVSSVTPSKPTQIFTEFVDAEPVGEFIEAYWIYMGDMICSSPRQCAMIEGIAE
jgi:hypothetical protein